MANRYDHRVRNAIVASGNPHLFRELNVPRSTIRDWLRKGPAQVITVAEFETSHEELVSRIKELEAELQRANAQSTLITKSINILGFQLQYKRIPSSDVKEALIETIQNAAELLPLQQCLELVQLSRARFRSWLVRQRKCQLEDRTSCPRLSPTALVTSEIAKIRDYVLDASFRSYSISSLALYAKRCGDVVASPSTWSRVIGKLDLIRPGKRVYPAKPKVGIRASACGQIWHLDQSVIKLKDGTRCFIQAVICNFSRYVLAWTVTETYGGSQTKKLLEQAISKAKEFGLNETPDVFVDSGTENINADIDSMIEDNLITRTIAQIEIDCSNSMIESLFHRLKNRHLYLQDLTSFDLLVKHTDFYLEEANERIPLAVLKGATPLEVISGKWTYTCIYELEIKSISARRKRIEQNRSLTCLSCPT